MVLDESDLSDLISVRMERETKKHSETDWESSSSFLITSHGGPILEANS